MVRISCILVGVAAAAEDVTGDLTSMLQTQIHQHNQDQACTPVNKGDIAPVNGRFNGQQVEIGEVAQESGNFCVEKDVLALVQRSFGFSSVKDIEVAVSAKASPTAKPAANSVEKSASTKKGTPTAAPTAAPNVTAYIARNRDCMDPATGCAGGCFQWNNKKDYFASCMTNKSAFVGVVMLDPVVIPVLDGQLGCKALGFTALTDGPGFAELGLTTSDPDACYGGEASIISFFSSNQAWFWSQMAGKVDPATDCAQWQNDYPQCF